MIRLGRPFAFAAILLAALAASPGPGATQPLDDQTQLATGSGFSAFDMTEAEVEEVSGMRRLMHVRSAGTFYTDEPDSPFNGTSYDCFGTHLLGPGDASLEGHGYCAGVAANGDLWWIDWTGDLVEGQWMFRGGTGIFDGIEGGGTWENQAALSGEEAVTTWRGAWRLPDPADR